MRKRIGHFLRRAKNWGVLPLLAWLALSAVVVFFMANQAETNGRLRSQYDTVMTTYGDLYEEAVVAGADPSAPAPEELPEADAAPVVQLPMPDPEPAPSGPRGPGPTQGQVMQALSAFCAVNDCTPIPTAAQVAEAIADFCADGACRGEDGSDGENGQDAPPVTADQIAAAVVTYCSEGACRGANGIDGKPGPPPTAQEVFEQVKVYCDANNGCQGPKGDTGDTGPKGVGIEKVACPDDADDDWEYTFTDGTVQIVPGPCRVSAPIIDPSPDPSPLE